MLVAFSMCIVCLLMAGKFSTDPSALSSSVFFNNAPSDAKFDHDFFPEDADTYRSLHAYSVLNSNQFRVFTLRRVQGQFGCFCLHKNFKQIMINEGNVKVSSSKSCYESTQETQSSMHQTAHIKLKNMELKAGTCLGC